MFRRDKNSRLDNEGLRRMREAIRQRLEQDEAATTSGEPGAEQPYPSGQPAGQGAYTYESLPTEPDYSYLQETGQQQVSEVASAAPESSAAPADESWRATAAPTGPAVTTVAADATWSGTLRSTADVRIEGTLDGEVEAERTLYIAPDARVEATARAAIIIVAGHLNGQIDCLERLEVLPSGHISGQIQAGAIVVHEGAFIGGQLRMRGQDATGDDGQSRPVLQRVR